MEQNNLTAEQLHKLIAIELMKAMTRSKETNLIDNRNKIFEILEKIKSGNYYYIHQDLNSVNMDAINNFNENKEVLFKNILKSVEQKLSFDIELGKYGKTFNSVRSRYALIMYPDGLWSIKAPLLSMDYFNRNMAKDKTEQLLASTIKAETKGSDSRDWNVNKKNFRLCLEYPDKTKSIGKDIIYLYFQTSTQLEDANRMLQLIKLNKSSNVNLISNLQSMQKLIEGSYIFYGVFKLLEVKQKVRHRKALLNSLREYTEESFEPCREIFRILSAAWIQKYKDDQKAPKRRNLPRYRYLVSNFTQEKEENKNFLAISDLSNSIKKIRYLFPKTLDHKWNDIGKTNVKGVWFKTPKCDFTGTHAHYQNTQFDSNRFKQSKQLQINKKDLQIISDNRNVINSQDILNISSIYMNSDLMNNHTDNCIVINGPKVDITKFFMYKFNDDFADDTTISLKTETFVEPEYHNLALNQTTENTKSLVLQIFHAIFVLEKRDIEHLEMRANREFIDPLNDFFFYLKLTINGNHKLRTKFVKPLDYKDNKLAIQFNLQEVFNLSSLALDSFEIKISLNIIPASCIDMEAKNNAFLVDYLNPYELGYCIINEEKISKSTYEYQFVKPEVNLSDDCKIIVNCVQTLDKLDVSKSFGKEYSIGHDIYALEEYDKYGLLRLLNNKRLWPDIQKSVEDIKYDNEDNIYLRLPNDNERKNVNSDEFIKALSSQVNDLELEKLMSVKSNCLLPFVEKFNKDSIKHSTNLSGNIKSIQETKVQEGDYIYKLKNISKYFNSSLKGISQNKVIVYRNNFTTLVNTNKIPMYFDKLFKNKYKPMQENQFNIYDFSEIDTASLQNADNYKWKIMIKFVNEIEMKTFLYYLKDLRRKSNVALLSRQLYVDKPIDKAILVQLSKPLTSKFRTLKVNVDRIEFRQGYNLSENKKLAIRIGTDSQNSKSSRYMLESLIDKDFTNKLAEDPDIANEIKRLKCLKGDFVYLSKEYELNSNTFNGSQKIVTFGAERRQMEMEIKQNSFHLDVVLKGNKADEIILSDDIKIPPNADMIYIPLYLNDGTFKHVVAIALLNVCSLGQSENKTFEELFEIHINNLEKVPKDDFKNFIRLGKYEPNVFKRRILKKIHQVMKSNIYNIDLTVQENRDKLYNILRSKCVKGAEALNSDQWQYKTEWRDLVIDINLLNQKLFKKFYFQKKRNEFYKIFSRCEWHNYLKKVNTSNGHNEENIYNRLPSISELKKAKANLNQNYLDTKYIFYLGIPHEKRLQTWEKMLNIDHLVELTKNRLAEGNEMFKEYSMQNIYLHYHDIVQRNSVFNITFSLIDNDMNLMTNITDFENPLQEMKNLKAIKTIAKAYFLWSELDITTDSFLKGEGKKFVYFNGILRIIQRLLSVFQDESTVFWLVIGLSQVIELFYQTNPLYTSELSYTKIYVLITKVYLIVILVNLTTSFEEYL
jgi:hypothetical protein